MTLTFLPSWSWPDWLIFKTVNLFDLNNTDVRDRAGIIQMRVLFLNQWNQSKVVGFGIQEPDFVRLYFPQRSDI